MCASAQLSFRQPKIPWWLKFYEKHEDIIDELPSFAYERLHNFLFARDIGLCDRVSLQNAADALAGGSGDPNAPYESARCLADAFAEELSPIPGLPLPVGGIPNW